MNSPGSQGPVWHRTNHLVKMTLAMTMRMIPLETTAENNNILQITMTRNRIKVYALSGIQTRFLPSLAERPSTGSSLTPLSEDESDALEISDFVPKKLSQYTSCKSTEILTCHAP